MFEIYFQNFTSKIVAVDKKHYDVLLILKGVTNGSPKIPYLNFLYDCLIVDFWEILSFSDFKTRT